MSWKALLLYYESIMRVLLELGSKERGGWGLDKADLCGYQVSVFHGGVKSHPQL